MTGTLRTAALATGLLIAGVACSSSSTTSETTTTSASRQGFQVATEDGQVSVSLDGNLPPNWPSSFPVPPRSTPAGSGSIGGSSQTVMIAVYSTTESPEQAYDFYTSQTQLPVESKASVGSGDRYVGTIKLGGAEPARVTVVPKSGQTYVVIVLQAGGAGGPGTTGAAGTTGTTTGTSTRDTRTS